MTQDTDYKMVAKTFFGLEDVLAAELLKLGAREIEKHNRAVSFVGDKGFMYKANLCLRTALNILKPIYHIQVSNENQLYTNIKKINWEQYITVKDTLAIDCSLNTDNFNHNQYVAQKTKDAIVDQFRDKYGARPSVDLENPTVRINIHIFRDQCTISLDSSGDSLYKRGYRENINRAPMKEILAAGLVMLSGWHPHFTLVDPMCGAGTIPIEAALWANNIPPGYFRKGFGFQQWKDYDEALFNTIVESAVNRIGDLHPAIFGSDISRTVARKAYDNVHEAKVEDVVKISTSAFEQLEAPAARGTLIMNPPYGERMDKDDDIMGLYKSIGDSFKKRWSGWDCWIISSNMEALKNIGLRPSRKITVFNGQLECKFMKFEMYAGTKRIHKLAEKKQEETN